MPNAKNTWVRYLLVTGLYLFLHRYLQPLLYSSPTVLPAYLWHEEGWVEIAPLSPAASFNLGSPEPFAIVKEEKLPWYANSPLDLRDLRTRFDTSLFINAFSLGLNNPLMDEEHNIALAAAHLAGTIIQPEQIFSLNKALGPRTEARGFGLGPFYVNGQLQTAVGGGLCKVATALYNLAAYCDLELVERHQHSMSVSYIPPGRDATLLWGVKDLRFRNDKKHSLLLWAEVWDKTLYVALYGKYDPPLVKWHAEKIATTPTWTIRRRNSSLASGETHFIPGAPGMSVKTWISVSYRGEPPLEKLFYTNYYRPLPNYREFGP